ncbi:hypothetical protein AXFE_27890 [Acidithrix ferrooxidans]|uniref:Uncharacterized protein n=1 Tax=Acidithrix ferrooxidans TaxID=1280514 RepID=A0A0D8HEQ6_9ACTN|nr:hypothetical protein P405_35 [uncultured Acidithrix sp.]KJF16344.1 hypothetical protein AXFE_27890 [Acidithrix ferrooxidans]CAG4913474.1 unnamed protein product [Acidithrix sp. C25]
MTQNRIGDIDANNQVIVGAVGCLMGETTARGKARTSS